MPRGTWRLLRDPPGSAAWNMSVDEALLEHCQSHGPALRLYAFERTSLSLGYRQPAEPWRARARGEGVPLVRRITGGGAVLHDRDLTYAVVVPRGHPGVPNTMKDAYVWIRRVLMLGLRAAGFEAAEPAESTALERRDPRADVCFSVSTGYEIELEGRKWVGSAQRRSRVGFLQHGSIQLGVDAALSRRLLDLDPLPALERQIDADELQLALIDAFERELGRPLEATPLSLTEQQAAQERSSARRTDALWIPPVSLRTARASADRFS